MTRQCIYISVYEPTWKPNATWERRVLHKIWPEKLEFLSLLSYETPINLKQGDHLLKLISFSFFFSRRTKPQICIIQVWLTIAGTFIRYACVCMCWANLFFFLSRDDPIHSFNKFTWVTLIYCGNMRAIVRAHLLQDVDDSSYNNTCKRVKGGGGLRDADHVKKVLGLLTCLTVFIVSNFLKRFSNNERMMRCVCNNILRRVDHVYYINIMLRRRRTVRKFIPSVMAWWKIKHFCFVCVNSLPSLFMLVCLLWSVDDWLRRCTEVKKQENCN